MPNNKFGNISSEKAFVANQETHRFVKFWKKSHKIINWSLVTIFLIGFMVILFVSIFPVFSVKYRLASSSFEKNIENKILEDYYASTNPSSNLPFNNLGDNKKVENLNDEIQSELSRLVGDYGVYVARLDNGEKYEFNSEKIFTAASLSKLFLTGAYYNAAESDPALMVNDTMLENQDKVEGNGNTYSEPVGSSYKPVDLIERMLKQSDNTAFAVMTRNLGLGRVTDFINNYGFSQTDFINNTTSPKDVGTFLEKLYRQEIMGKDYTDEMIGFMQNTSFEDRLPFYLPGVKIAHKIGTWDGAYSDAGIVYGKSGDYIIVVMTDSANYTEAVNAMRKLSEVVYNYFNG
ncbi:MAG: class A beta-lactamase-related serine hydrolase [Patescibacteria group bacterium]|nr:class A beta-lactamase-related serine hydrolase [Patescibacteria group bacterium]